MNDISTAITESLMNALDNIQFLSGSDVYLVCDPGDLSPICVMSTYEKAVAEFKKRFPDVDADEIRNFIEVMTVDIA